MEQQATLAPNPIQEQLLAALKSQNDDNGQGLRDWMVNTLRRLCQEINEGEKNLNSAYERIANLQTENKRLYTCLDSCLRHARTGMGIMPPQEEQHVERLSVIEHHIESFFELERKYRGKRHV